MTATFALGPLRTLTVTGDVRERARQQGRAFARELAPAASAICSFFLPPRFFPRRVHERLSVGALFSAGAWFAQRYRRVLTEHAGGKYDRALHGLAAGAGISHSLALGVSGVPEVLAAQISYFLPPGGCTSIVVPRERGEHGAAQILYNHDFPARLGPYLFVRRNEATDALHSVCLTYAMTFGNTAGVNEAGLAMAANTAFVADFPGFHDQPLVFATHALQEVLDRCRTVAEAVALLEETRVATGLIVSLADAGGDRAVVEMSCTRVRTRRPDESLMVSVNKYRHPDMQEVEIPVTAVCKGVIEGLCLHETNLVRQKRLDALLAALPERIGRDQVTAVLGDHEGPPGNNNVCRHFDMGETLATLVLDAGRRSLSISWGHACRPHYFEHRVGRASG